MFIANIIVSYRFHTLNIFCLRYKVHIKKIVENHFLTTYEYYEINKINEIFKTFRLFYNIEFSTEISYQTN